MQLFCRVHTNSSDSTQITWSPHGVHTDIWGTVNYWIDAREILIVWETREYDHLLKETDTIVSHDDQRITRNYANDLFTLGMSHMMPVKHGNIARLVDQDNIQALLRNG